MENSNFSTPITVVVEVTETDCHAARISVIEKDVSDPQHERFVSITMPASPGGAHLMAGVIFEDAEKDSKDVVPDSDKTYKEKHKSRSMPKDHETPDEAIASRSIPNNPTPRIDRLREKRFDSFKTWSGKLERNISNLCHHHRSNGQAEQAPDSLPPQHAELPVDRYFDALEGPELETLRASEEIVLPKEEQWPFLLRFPISSFGICLGVGSQAIMWKTLGSSTSTEFLHISMEINLVFWLITVFLVLIVSLTYILKIVFYFEAVRREYYHPIRVNFLFAPWIALLFLALGLPPSISGKLPPCLWYILMAPIFCLELKIYGQWMSGGERRLSKVANPSNHLAVVGNFVGALLGASMGLKEGPIFFFAIGLAHYTVLFVTLYQRLPTNATLPKELHPVFFLFVAAPSVASMAWATIQGEFGYGSRIAYFIAMFLYFSLAVRVNFFRGFRFSLSWWAYTFPMTGAAIATIRYTDVATSVVTKILTVVLCTVATIVVASLLVTTVVHAFVLRDLFPNDIAIAISERKPKTSKWYLRRSGSTDVEQYLKFADSPRKDVDVEVCVSPTPAKVKQVTVVKDVEACLSPVVSDVEVCMSQMMNDCQACTTPR